MDSAVVQRRLIQRALALGLAWSIAPAAAGIEVRLELRGLTAPVMGQLVVRSAASSAEETTYPLRSTFELPTPSADARVTCRGEGLWCPEVRLSGEVATLPVLPAMTVTGRVARAVEVPPSAGLVQGVARPPGSAGEPLELRHELTLDDGRFRFTAPRAELDLRFAFPGAAPIYRWDVQPPQDVDAAAEVSLGALPLRPGASLSGWVRRQEDDLPLRGAAVAVHPLTQAGETPPPLHRWTAASDERGFFQIHGLQPGSYRLEISAAEHVPEVREAVEIEAGSETLIGTVRLSPPLRLTLQLVPPRHPSGKPWTVELSPVHRLPGEDRVETVADGDGRAELEALRPAEHYLKVKDPDGGNLWFETRHLAADTWLPIELPIVAVEGTVRLGDEPLAATVKLEGGAGDRVEIASDEHGVLSGWMRTPDRPWLMATVTWREAGERRQRLVEVVPDVEEDVLQVDIDLPAGVVHGEVVDLEGEPQRGVRVRATPVRRSSRFTEIRGETDASGRFHLTGLDAAEYLVQAGAAGGAHSEAARLDLASGSPAGPVRLVIRPTRALRLQVTAGGEAVAGARVELVGFGRIPVTTHGTTDARGWAELEVPEEVARAVATVSAPSRFLWSGCVPVAGDTLTLPLPDAVPATLSLTLEARADLPPLLGNRLVLLTGDGGFLDFSALAYWNRLRGAERDQRQDGEQAVERLVLPGLAPGSYALLSTGAPETELAARTCAGTLSGLEWVTLPPGGEAELHSGSSTAQAERLRELTGP